MNMPRNNIIWNMTRKCNFRCHYCYFPHDNSPVTETIPVKDITNFLDTTEQAWVVGLTGGEPFIYPGIIEICEALTQKHFIGIDTNLSVSGKVQEFAQRIDPRRVKNLYVALHIEERERIKGVDAFIRNARLLIDKGFEVIVNYVVHPDLVDRFPTDKAFYASHGITITPRPFKGKHEGRRYPEAYGERAKAIFADHPEQGKKIAFNFQGLPCSAGRTLLRMEPDGTVFRCPGDKTVLGTVQKQVSLYQGSPPCIKRRCPCRGLDHVTLTQTQSDLVDGVQYAVVGDNDTARHKLEQALAATPNHPCAENNLGVVAFRDGDLTTAQQYFSDALSREPDNELYQSNMAGADKPNSDFDAQICLNVSPKKLK